MLADVVEADDEKPDSARWTVRVGTNMEFMPSPGSRILLKRRDDDGNVEYIVELPHTDDDNDDQSAPSRVS